MKKCNKENGLSIMEGIEKSIKELNLSEPIVIVGHDNIDVDSFLSCIMCRKFLTFLGIDSVIKINDPHIDEETRKIISYLGYNIDEYIAEVKETDFIFLVDHHVNTTKGKAMWCIDHHPTEQKNDFLYYVNRNASSATKIVYDIMEQVMNYPFTQKDILDVIISIMVDTVSMKSNKCLEEDKIWVRKKCQKFGFDFNYLYDLCLCMTDLSKPVEKIVMNGIKYYNYSGNKVVASYIQSNDILGNKKINEIIEYLHNYIIENDIKLWVFIMCDMAHDTTNVLYLSRYGHSIKIFTGIISRGKNIMPFVEENIELLIQPNSFRDHVKEYFDSLK